MSSVALATERLEEAVGEFKGTATRKQVKIKQLKTDPAYQRDVSPRLVETIQNHWDERAAEAIIVSLREDGDMYIVNGQHRVAAATKLGHTWINSIVIEGMSLEAEAALRVKMNMRIPDSPLDRHRAQVLAGDQESIAIDALLTKHDTFINRIPTAAEGINAITTVEKIYRHDKGYTLDQVLSLVKLTWGEPHGPYATAPILRSLAWFLDKHATDAMPEELAELLRGYGVKALDRRARSLWGVHGGPLWLNYYRAMVEIYNELRPDKQKLEWKTRGSTRSPGMDSGSGGSD